MSAWRIVTNFAIPPALVLTILLVIPTPRVIKKGLLSFTRKVLFFEVAGGLRLVHFMLLATGLAWAKCGITTAQLAQAHTALAGDEKVSANQRMAFLAKKWREERNFWIATVAFSLWALLYRFYQLMMQYMAVQENNKVLLVQLGHLQKQLESQGVAAKIPTEPSAPVMDVDDEGKTSKDSGLTQRTGKKKET